MSNQTRHYHLGCGERLQAGYQIPVLKNYRKAVEPDTCIKLKYQKHDKRRAW